MSEKICLIAGASRGIGYAIAEQLLNDGHKVIACCRQPNMSSLDSLRELGADIRTLDILSDQSINALSEELKAAYPHLDVIINCVGILHDTDIHPEKRASQIKRSALHRVFNTNAFGHIMLLQALEPLLKNADKFVCASISTRVGSISDNEIGGWYSYRASKAALNMLLKTLSIEFARKYKEKACVLSLHPGTTDTHLSKPFQKGINWTLYSPKDTANNLLSIILHADASQSGEFIAFDKNLIPY